jgi:hypothetical protein
MAKLLCRCEQVDITIPNKPLNRLECCCTDCRKGLEWCATKANQPLPVLNDAIYFANAVQVNKGMDKMTCYMIKEGYNTRRIVATCCWTCLLGDHPVYQGKRFISFLTSVRVRLEDNSTPLIPASRRIFQNDLDPKVRSSLVEFATPSKENLPADEEKELAIQNAQKLVSGSGGEYITVQDLMGQLGELQFMDPQFNGPEPEWNKKMKKARYA